MPPQVKVKLRAYCFTPVVDRLFYYANIDILHFSSLNANVFTLLSVCTHIENVDVHVVIKVLIFAFMGDS